MIVYLLNIVLINNRVASSMFTSSWCLGIFTRALWDPLPDKYKQGRHDVFLNVWQSSDCVRGSKEADKESEDGESAAYPESEGLPKNSKETGMELALMGNLYDLVNENLMDSWDGQQDWICFKLETDL